MNNLRKTAVTTLVAVSLLIALAAPAFAAGMTGALFTTDSTCTGVNLNIFGAKDEVYINGGPAHPGAAGLRQVRGNTLLS